MNTTDLNEKFRDRYYRIRDAIIGLQMLNVSEKFDAEVSKLYEQLQKVRKLYETEVSKDWD